MNLTLTIVYKTKKTNKLYYTGDNPSVLILLKLLNWKFPPVTFVIVFGIFQLSG